MKSQLRSIDDHGIVYTALMFVCPGCETPYSLRDSDGNDTGEMHTPSGLHMLAVNSILKKPSWTWDGNLEAPTLSPSILMRTAPYSRDKLPKPLGICHSYLKAGIFEFLADCTHGLAGRFIPMPDLDEWAIKQQRET